MQGSRTVETEITEDRKTKAELADSHCHLDMVDSKSIEKAIEYGVATMVTNGVDTGSNSRGLEISDGVHVFAALGIGPDHAGVSDDELDFDIALMASNRKRIVAVGEAGLDYRLAKTPLEVARQKLVFGRLVDTAVELDLPISVHSRNAMDDVFAILEERNARKVHLHFFEGDAAHAREAAKRGYMISVPPIESTKRGKAIKETPIELIMAESDSPAAGLTPIDVERSVMFVAKAKGMAYNRAAELLTQNTKRFFNIPNKTNLAHMR